MTHILSMIFYMYSVALHYPFELEHNIARNTEVIKIIKRIRREQLKLSQN